MDIDELRRQVVALRREQKLTALVVVAIEDDGTVRGLVSGEAGTDARAAVGMAQETLSTIAAAYESGDDPRTVAAKKLMT